MNFWITGKCEQWPRRLTEGPRRHGAIPEGTYWGRAALYITVPYVRGSGDAICERVISLILPIAVERAEGLISSEKIATRPMRVMPFMVGDVPDVTYSYVSGGSQVDWGNTGLYRIPHLPPVRRGLSEIGQ